MVVDIRVGSPTFGQWDAVLLDDRDHRSIYISEGLRHAFLALQDDSTVMYFCSAGYNPGREHTINPLDPAIGIAWPDVDKLVLSDRDGLLPTLEETQAFVEELRGPR